MRQKGIITVIFVLCTMIMAPLVAPRSVYAGTAEEVEQLIQKRNQQIQELENLIQQYEQTANEKRTQAKTVQQQIADITRKVEKTLLEIKSLSIAISELSLEIQRTQKEINLNQLKTESSLAGLRTSLKALARAEESNPFSGMIIGKTLSSFFSDLYDFYFLQSTVQNQLTLLKQARGQLEKTHESLESERVEQEHLKRLEELARAEMEKQKKNQKNLLAQVKKDEQKIVEKIKVTKTDIAKIKEEVTYLIRAGISVEDAIRYGQLAAIRLGIRPAFLIGLLEVESRLGLNVGKGTWTVDMPARDHEAFKAICTKLNLDPDKTPVSKKPSYGWGGAMGPAQFIPTTWLAYEAKIAKLTGHSPPSPWNIEDAFTAAAIKLASQGATSKTRAGEIAAAKGYISGSSSCTKAICNSYARAVLDKAEAIEANLSSTGT